MQLPPFCELCYTGFRPFWSKSFIKNGLASADEPMQNAAIQPIVGTLFPPWLSRKIHPLRGLRYLLYPVVQSRWRNPRKKMKVHHPGELMSEPMAQERRQHKRYELDCPVTVFTPGRGKKRMLGRGWLHDINEKGARFIVDQSLPCGQRITLEVGFSGPDGEVTAMRFPATVKRVVPHASYEVAVSFLKGGSFVRRADTRYKRLVRIQRGKSSWIN